MTLIIGIEDPANNRAIVCADSGAWRGGQKDTLRRSKLWSSNGWICGLAGHYSQLQHLRAVAPLPQTDVETRDELEEALSTWTLKVLSTCGDLTEAIRKADPKEEPHGPALIVARDQWVWY